MTQALLDWDLLKQLCAIHAVSGREDRMTAFVYAFIQDYVDEAWVDNLGNVVGILKGRETPDQRLMLQAHMDELGLIVRYITPEGYLLIERVGGVPEKSLLGQRVEVLTERGQLVPGFIGTKSHHITSAEEKFVVPKIHDLFIDLGVQSAAEVERLGVQVGDPVTYTPNFERFGDGMICSKALDNRVGVFILLEVLRALAKERPPCSIVFSFSVLEEFSIRGSLPTVNATQPNAILSVDITIAVDTPLDRPLHPVKLRHGPAVKMMDFHGRGTLGGLFSSPKWRAFIEQTARQHHIPLQREVIVGVITDPAFQLYLGERGYIIAGVSVPQRYSHASIQMCHETDIQNTFELVQHVALGFTAELDLHRG